MRKLYQHTLAHLSEGFDSYGDNLGWRILRSRFFISVTAGVLLSGCTGYDLSDRQIAFLAEGEDTHFLYVAKSSGEGRITIASDVRDFNWLPDREGIEIVKESLEEHRELSDFSVYHVILADAHNSIRVREATGPDTLLITMSPGDLESSEEYLIRNDSLYFKGEEEELFINARVRKLLVR